MSKPSSERETPKPQQLGEILAAFFPRSSSWALDSRTLNTGVAVKVSFYIFDISMKPT